MSTYVPPKRGVEFIFYIGLPSQAASTGFQSNPTIAAGDFKVSIDGGALANPATLPAVTPASSKMVKVTLSAAEMTGDNITLIASDAAGAEWCDVIVNLQTAARQIDDLAFPTTSGRSLDVTAGGAAGIDWGNVENPTTTVDLTGTTISVTQVIASVSGAVASVTGAVGSVVGNVGGNVVGTVASVVGNVGGNVVGTVASVVGNVGGNVVGTVASVVGNVAGNVVGSIGSLATQAKADVNTEVLDVLNVDTFAEPGQGAPAATTTLVAKIGYLYKFLRNKVTQTSAVFSVYNDAGDTVDQKSTVSDSGTVFTRGEIESGP